MRYTYIKEPSRKKECRVRSLTLEDKFKLLDQYLKPNKNVDPKLNV